MGKTVGQTTDQTKLLGAALALLGSSLVLLGGAGESIELSSGAVWAIRAVMLVVLAAMGVVVGLIIGKAQAE